MEDIVIKSMLAKVLVPAINDAPAYTIKIFRYLSTSTFSAQKETFSNGESFSDSDGISNEEISVDELISLVTGAKPGFNNLKWSISNNGEYVLKRELGLTIHRDGKITASPVVIEIPKLLYDKFVQVALQAKPSVKPERYFEMLIEHEIAARRNPGSLIKVAINLGTDWGWACMDLTEKLGLPIEKVIEKLVEDNASKLLKSFEETEDD